MEKVVAVKNAGGRGNGKHAADPLPEHAWGMMKMRDPRERFTRQAPAEPGMSCWRRDIVVAKQVNREIEGASMAPHKPKGEWDRQKLYNGNSC